MQNATEDAKMQSHGKIPTLSYLQVVVQVELVYCKHAYPFR